MSSEREDLAEVLSAHRIVGVSGYGIESVMCACQYNGWTGGGKWHPADWHPRHVAKKLLAAGWRPPTERTDAEVEDAANALFLHAHTDDEGDVSEQCVPDEDDMRYYRVAATAALEAADKVRAS